MFLIQMIMMNLFNLFILAVKASINNSLIDVSKDTVINGDRTALAIHSNLHANKVCKYIDQCEQYPCKSNCSPLPYGRVIYRI